MATTRHPRDHRPPHPRRLDAQVRVRHGPLLPDHLRGLDPGRVLLPHAQSSTTPTTSSALAPTPDVVIGCLLDTVNALAGIATAVAFYPVARRLNESLALGFVTTRMFEAAVIMVGVVSLLAVVTLRQDGAGTTGADQASLLTTGHALVAIRDYTFQFGPNVAAALNALMIGTILYRSRLVPRIIPAMGLLAVVPLLVSQRRHHPRAHRAGLGLVRPGRRADLRLGALARRLPGRQGFQALSTERRPAARRLIDPHCRSDPSDQPVGRSGRARDASSAFAFPPSSGQAPPRRARNSRSTKAGRMADAQRAHRRVRATVARPGIFR